jgi:membrane protease YdiL (CAAX protease family)
MPGAKLLRYRFRAAGTDTGSDSPVMAPVSTRPVPRIDRALAAAVAAGPLFWLLWCLASRPVLNLSWPAHEPLRFALLALAYPVVEELAFRGYVQGVILRTSAGSRSWRGWSLANGATSVLFALAHVFAHAPLWAAAALFPSLVFGFFRDRYGRVLPSIGLHVWYNVGYFWLFGAA